MHIKAVTKLSTLLTMATLRLLDVIAAFYTYLTKYCLTYLSSRFPLLKLHYCGFDLMQPVLYVVKATVIVFYWP